MPAKTGMRNLRLSLVLFSFLAPAPTVVAQNPQNLNPPKMVTLPCSDLETDIQSNKIYQYYLKARAIRHDEALAQWDWYKHPPPPYGDQTFEPLYWRPPGVDYPVFEMKRIQCVFPDSAELEGIDFTGSDLTGSSFVNAHLAGARFHRWNFNGPRTVLRNVKFDGSDLSGASFDYADVAGVDFEPSKLPAARDIAYAVGLEQMTFDLDPSALASLRQTFREGGFSEQDRKITYAIHRRQQEQYRATCGGFQLHNDGAIGACIDYEVYNVIDCVCQFGMNLWRPATIGFCAWIAFALLFFAFMHHPGSSGLYLAEAKGFILTAEESQSATQVRSSYALEQLRGRNILGWIREELRLLRIAAFFSLVNGFNLGFKEADVGRWIKMLPGREFEFHAVGWARSMAGLQALLTLFLLAIWALCVFGHPFG